MYINNEGIDGPCLREFGLGLWILVFKGTFSYGILKVKREQKVS